VARIELAFADGCAQWANAFFHNTALGLSSAPDVDQNGLLGDHTAAGSLLWCGDRKRRRGKPEASAAWITASDKSRGRFSAREITWQEGFVAGR